MADIGYEYLRTTLRLGAFTLERPARVKPVTRVEAAATFLAVPRHVAPQTNDPLQHLLFALKHEGVNLQVLAEALTKIDPNTLLAELRRQPSGSYIRIACFLWEGITGNRFTDIPDVGGPTVELFDPDRYLTGPAQRDARWRIAFNGLGSIHYCATVERTSYLNQAI